MFSGDVAVAVSISVSIARKRSERESGASQNKKNFFHNFSASGLNNKVHNNAHPFEDNDIIERPGSAERRPTEDRNKAIGRARLCRTRKHRLIENSPRLSARANLKCLRERDGAAS